MANLRLGDFVDLLMVSSQLQGGRISPKNYCLDGHCVFLHEIRLDATVDYTDGNERTHGTFTNTIMEILYLNKCIAR